MSYKLGETNWYSNKGYDTYRDLEHQKPWIPGGTALLAEAAAIVALLPSTPCRVLDAGCAGGHLSHILSLYDHRVVGIDVCEEVIKRNKNCFVSWHKQTDPFFCVQDFDNLADCDFDAIVFASALHHSVCLRKTLQSCYNALKPGGMLIANEPGILHEQSKGCANWVETMDVTERSTPPYKIIREGKKIGFHSCKVYPNAISLHKATYCTHDFEMYHPYLAKIASPLMFIFGKWFHGLTVMHK